MEYFPSSKTCFLSEVRTVGNGAQSTALDVVRVVAGTLVVVIAAFADAVLDHHGEEWGGGVFGKHLIDVVADSDFLIDHVIDLFVEGVVELFVGGEIAGVTGGDPCHFAGAGVDAIIQSDLEHLGHVEVAGEDVGLFTKGTNLDTPGTSTFAGIGERFPLTDHLQHIGIGVKHGGVSVALANDVDRRL